jgi:hypothetical protein
MTYSMINNIYITPPFYTQEGAVYAVQLMNTSIQNGTVFYMPSQYSTYSSLQTTYNKGKSFNNDSFNNTSFRGRGFTSPF